jgi:hypothetical protein
MATLGSPGVQVPVIDESFYSPAAPGTVPMIFVASAQDKSNASATGTAQGTTAANAGKVWAITSQRDLTDTFGTPLFYTDASGNSLHGNELNEYGLQAAYSLLGASSKAYVVRADIDLAQLEPTTTIPTGNPVAGRYWLDTDNSLYGVYEWNATTSKFTNKVPLVIDDTNYLTDTDDGWTPSVSLGKIGDYAIVIKSNSVAVLWYKNAGNTWTVVEDGFETKKVWVSPHTSYPNTTGALTGSVWIKTTSAAKGANWVLKYFNGSTKSWVSATPTFATSRQAAIRSLDYSGGGKNIPVGTTFVETNNDHGTYTTADFKLWTRSNGGETVSTAVVTTATVDGGVSFFIRETRSNSATDWGNPVVVSFMASPNSRVAAQIPAAINGYIGSGQLNNVVATYNSTTNTLSFKHALGGDIEFLDGTNTPLASSGFLSSNTSNLSVAPTGDTAVNPLNTATTITFSHISSNWKPLSFVATDEAPVGAPAEGRLWFNNSVTDVDIMIHNGTTWVGYKNGVPGTDPAGPIVAALAPTVNSLGNALVNGDIWVSTADMERYGRDVYVYSTDTGWVLQDVTDQETPDGWVFADARWATSGASTTPSTIVELLSSNYLDPDAPDPALYPKGTKLWNTRRSGNNVKKYISNYLNLDANNGVNIRYNSEDMSGYAKARWVSQENRNEDGSGRFGRFAQRGVITSAFKALIDSNQAIRDTDTLVFNLMAAPGYPEAIQNMLAFNADRGYTAMVVGDTPFRLPANGTALAAWGSNTAAALDNGDDGLVSADDYGLLSVFYPSGYTTDNAGNNIVVPPSHMMLRTIVNSDAKSYQWFAPAGIRRGGIDNATSVGYIDSASGEFKTASLHESLRDVLQQSTVNINPIATMPGIGMVNYGQKTRYRGTSALDRMNVARLIAYLRRQLGVVARPYLFEPNDEQTRRELKAAVDSVLLELVGQRAIYDFVTVCDTTNNTNARIDRSELWLDVAVEPVKAVEFIYIPLRIKKTGSIASGV